MATVSVQEGALHLLVHRVTLEAINVYWVNAAIQSRQFVLTKASNRGGLPVAIPARIHVTGWEHVTEYSQIRIFVRRGTLAMQRIALRRSTRNANVSIGEMILVFGASAFAEAS
jgi:hypothetical protein